MLAASLGLPHFEAGPVINAADLPACAGAYALFIEVPNTVGFLLRGMPISLATGSYVYCGSARGPGGIRARVARHLKDEKALRWHVDRLTSTGRVVGVLAAPDGTECDLLERFARLERAEIPVAGFGSSDCRHCPAHLLRIDGGFDASHTFARRRDELLIFDEERLPSETS